jgi:hypothetical protein
MAGCAEYYTELRSCASSPDGLTRTSRFLDQFCCTSAACNDDSVQHSQGMESKNMKSRADCAEQLAATLRERGSIVLFKGPRSKRTSLAVRRLAALSGERDSALRQAALSALMVIYEQEGSEMWNKLGTNIPPTQRDLIAERVKYIDKELARHKIAAGSVV